jgi:hypothetical protein
MSDPAAGLGSPQAVISRWHHDHGAALLAYARRRSPGSAIRPTDRGSPRS